MRGVKTFYHYSDSGLVAEINSNGNTLKSYGYRPGSPWGTDPLFMRENGKNYWYLNDHLGTPQQIVAENGGVVWKAQYQVFGKAEISNDSTVTNNLRFPGQYYDEETGMHYNWNRYYDPESGRYTQVDPIKLFGGLNLYGYTQNNPILSIDPWGLVWVTVDYDYYGVKNWIKWYWNRWISQIGKGMDPTFPGADPEEFLGLERDVLQEWRPDPENPCKDGEFPVGTRRRVPQKYRKFFNPGPHEVLINNPNEPYYYQWEPWVPPSTYDEYPDVKYENLYYLIQGE